MGQRRQQEERRCNVAILGEADNARLAGPYDPKVLLTYVDESYTDNWFTMAALLVDGPAAVALTQELDRVATAADRAYGLGADVELHGHEIFHAKKAWSAVPVRARVGVFDDVVEAVAGQDVRVIARAMDVVGQRARYARPEPPQRTIRELMPVLSLCDQVDLWRYGRLAGLAVLG